MLFPKYRRHVKGLAYTTAQTLWAFCSSTRTDNGGANPGIAGVEPAPHWTTSESIQDIARKASLLHHGPVPQIAIYVQPFPNPRTG